MSVARHALVAEIRDLLRQRGTEALDPAAFRARIGSGKPIETAAPRPKAEAPRDGLAFSLMFFSAVADAEPRNGLYELVLEAARFADTHDFAAVWLPERHFHRFGGPYPDPAVLAGAIAASTSRVRIRAGSVIAPLDHPLRIAERWAMVDNLSGGRVDISFGRGWNPNDFVLAPDNFAQNSEVFRTHVDRVRRLWRGEAIPFANGEGEAVPTAIFPRPLQPELPVWISATGSPETVRWAGAAGFNLLTMVLGGDLDQLGGKIAAYREARAAAGHDPAGGTVTLMLHTFVHADPACAEAAVREPLVDYVRSSLDAQRHGSAEGKALSAAQREQIVAFAVERYRRSAALFGTPEEALAVLDRARAIGADEIACLIDFGIADDLVLEGLTHLDTLRQRHAEAVRKRMRARQAPRATVADCAASIAVIGIGARLPQSPDHWAFWHNLCAGRELIGPAPAGRWGDIANPALTRGGFLDDVEGFEAERFNIAPSEAALMDPHQRLFLEAVWRALEDAGLRPSDLRGSDTGVFAAVYSTGHAERAAAAGAGPAVDPLAVTGGIRSMTPNRVSFVFDWTGPSEVVDTACSSGLVALHRAVRALRDGECGLALAGGVSLLLSDAENAGLTELGVLSEAGRCRPFDVAADGQVRGEGVGVVLLKRLADAERDGDFVYAVIRGSAVNHNGGRSGSLTLPNSHRQADCLAAACRDAGVELDTLSYIEAHGAGSAVGDLSEISAFGNAWRRLANGNGEAACAIGSVKANMGSLDAAGGIAALIKTVLALHRGTLPGMPGLESAAPECSLAGTPFRYQTTTADWPATAGTVRRAGVNAYGLGGVNAHVVLEAHKPARSPATAAAGPWLVVLWAPSPEALAASRDRLRAFLDDPASSEIELADIAYTLLVGRERFAHSWHAVADSRDELRRALAGEAESLSVPAPLKPLIEAFESGKPLDRKLVDRLQPGRRAPLPPGAFARRHFPLPPVSKPPETAQPLPNGHDPVARFYDFVTRRPEPDFDELYLTLAPFPDIIEGFSWTRTYQDPAAHRSHFALMLERQREMREVAFAGIDFAQVGRALDFGCGLATDLIALAARHPRLQGVGYTIAPAQAEAARARVTGRGLDARIAIHCRDSAHDPFPGTFDLAFGFEVAHHIADKPALFANLAAHLAKDGRLVLADCIANTVAPIELPALGAYTSPRDDYARLLADAGFAVVECVDLSPEIANFLRDPGLEEMLARERSATRNPAGEADRALAADVQRSWNGFGEALRTGLVLYALIVAAKDPDHRRALATNRRHLGVGTA